MEENTRLTDLTRMLLSSQAFSGFLSELSGTGQPTAGSVLPQSQAQPQPQPTQKDVNPHQYARQLQHQQQQIGMATIPERPVNFPLVETTNSGSSWNSALGLNNFPVYSVLDVPEGPALDLEKLTGKSKEAYPVTMGPPAKVEFPTIEYPTTFPETERSALSTRTCAGKIEADKEELYPLFAESCSTPFIHMVHSDRRKVTTHESSVDFDLICNEVNAGSARSSSLEETCARLDEISARIEAITGHLS
jgi:bZIP-type transcription factor MBZ1